MYMYVITPMPMPNEHTNIDACDSDKRRDSHAGCIDVWHMTHVYVWYDADADGSLPDDHTNIDACDIRSDKEKRQTKRQTHRRRRRQRQRQRQRQT